MIDESPAGAVEKSLTGALCACVIGLVAGAVVQFGNLPVAVGSARMPEYLAPTAGLVAALAGGLLANGTVSGRGFLGAVIRMAALTYLLGVGLLCTLALGGLNRAGLLPFGVLLPLAFILYAPLLAMMLIPAAVWVAVIRGWFQEAGPAGDDWDPRKDPALEAERQHERPIAGR